MPERVIPTNFQDDETLVFKVASLLMRAMCSQASARLLVLFAKSVARDILAVVCPLIEARQDEALVENACHVLREDAFGEQYVVRFRVALRARLAAQRKGEMG